MLLYQPFALSMQLKAAPAPGVQSSLEFLVWLYFHFALSSSIRTAIFNFYFYFCTATTRVHLQLTYKRKFNLGLMEKEEEKGNKLLLNKNIITIIRR